MKRMPTNAIAVSAILAVALVLIAVPFGSTAHASGPVGDWMQHDGGGSARFEPDELPDPFVRDFGDRYVWWAYVLHGNNYVRAYHPAKFGDREISYRRSGRAEFHRMMGSMVEAPPSTMEGTTADVQAEGTQAEAPDDGSAAEEGGGFSTLVTAVEAAGLEDIVFREGPVTVFAPTDEAFAALPEGTLEELLADPEGALAQVLLHHVVPGIMMSGDLTDGLELETRGGTSLTVSVSDDGVMIADAKVIEADIETDNGVVHVIDAVMLPPEDEAAGTEESMVEESVAVEAVTSELPTNDIVDTAAEASDFAALLAAAGATDLADLLRSEGPFTLFAPNDAAFAALPEGALEELLADPSGELTQIVKYHVVAGIVTAEELTDGASLETLQGASITVSVDGDSTLIDGANLLYPDIKTANGVIHVIDAVLQPPID